MPKQNFRSLVIKAEQYYAKAEFQIIGNQGRAVLCQSRISDAEQYYAKAEFQIVVR